MTTLLTIASDVASCSRSALRKGGEAAIDLQQIK